MRPPPGSDQRQHILTVGLEEYFQADALAGTVGSHRWARFERRLERGLSATLDLLDETGAEATFFVLGWVADRSPELVRRIAERGHTIANRGYSHRTVRTLPRGAWLDDLARARECIESATALPVHGHRAARLWYHPGDVRALDLLAAAGYSYDSSIAPLLRRRSPDSQMEVHQHTTPSGSTITELPISSTRLLGLQLPFSGGNYLRQLPWALVERAIADWITRRRGPMTFYFHTWELDAAQPRLPAPLHQQLRHYRNLDRMHDRLAAILQQHRFVSAERYLGLMSPGREPGPIHAAATPTSIAPPAATVIVPVANVGADARAVVDAIRRVHVELAPHAEVRWIVVDDGSTDRTWGELINASLPYREISILRLPEPEGIAGAIRAGILRAFSEIVYSARVEELDALPNFVGASVATRSTLVISRASEADNTPPTPAPLYGYALAERLGWFGTLRRYRRSSVAGLRLEHGSEEGLAELVAATRLANGDITVLGVSGVAPELRPEPRRIRRIAARVALARIRRRSRRAIAVATGGMIPRRPEFGL